MGDNTVQAKQRTLRRLGYRLKRALSPQQQVEEQIPKKTATLADIASKVKHYEKGQGPANFTGPRLEKDAFEWELARHAQHFWGFALALGIANHH